MVKDKKINAILIFVSPDSSYEVISKILKFKKPFFTEKPAGININETKKLMTNLKKYKTLNMVGFNRRFYSVFEKGLNLINSSGGLRVVNIEAHERFWKIKNNLNSNIKKNWIYINNIHMIDLIRFFGGEIKKIKYLCKKFDETFNDYNIASIEYKSGALGNFSSYWNSPGGWSVKLFSKDITVVFEPLEKAYWIDKNFNKKSIKPSKSDQIYKMGFYKQMKRFKEIIVNEEYRHDVDLFSSYLSAKIAYSLIK